MSLTVTDRGISGNNTGAASDNFSPNATLTAGNVGIFYLAADNAGGSSTQNLPGDVTDTQGNVWRRVLNMVNSGAANVTADVALWWSRLTSNFGAGDHFTLTYLAANVVAKAGSFIEVAATSPNVVMVVNNTTSSATYNVSAAPTQTTNATAIGQLVIGGAAAECADLWVGVSGGTNGTWSTKQSGGFGSGATGMSVITQWKVQTTATATNTWNPTISSGTPDGIISSIFFTECDSKVRGIGSSANSATSATVTVALPIAAGSTCVLAVAADNSVTGGGTPQFGTVTDTQSNTWTLRQNTVCDPGAANAGTEIGIYTSTLTNGLATTDTLTINWTTTAVPVKCWVLYEFSESTGYANSGVTNLAATTTPTITSGSITNGNIIVGVTTAEGDDQWTRDSDTTNGSWTMGADNCGNQAAAGSNQCIIVQYKKTTGGGTQTYNPTSAATVDTCSGWVELTVPTPSGNTSSAFLNFFP